MHLNTFKFYNMNYYSPFFGVFLLISISCSLDDSSKSQEEELAFLNQQKNGIEQLASSASCSESSTCNYVAFGSKPCGGPWTYLAYNSAIDEDLFLNKVGTYNANEEVYNLKWGIISDCSFVVPPNSVDCIGGKCTTVYN